MNDHKDKPGGESYSRLSFDPSTGRRLRHFDVMNPLEAINSPGRARLAVEGGYVAAAGLGGFHIFVALFHWVRPPWVTTLIGSYPAVLAMTNLCAAVIAFYLYAIIRNRRPLWAYWFVLGWCALALIPGVTRWIYGFSFGQFFPLGLLFLWCSIAGLRGWYALRRFKMEGVDDWYVPPA